MEGYRPDRVVKVLTSLVSVAYLGLMVAGVVVLVALLIIKLAGVEDSEWVIGMTVPVVPVDWDATVVTRWGEAVIEVEEMRGSLRLPLTTLPWWLFAFVWGYAAAAMALTRLFLHHLRRVFLRVRDGTPFDARNAAWLRWLGMIALALAALEAVSELVATLAVRAHVVSENLEVPVGLSADGWLVFFGLVLLSLAEIFRRGAELEEDQSFTV